MTEEVPINTIETEATPADEPQAPEVTAETHEVVETPPEKPKRKSKKTKEEAVETPAVKRKSAKKKAEKVEIIPVQNEEVGHYNAPPATPVEAVAAEEYSEPSFKEVQKSMAELQTEFRRLRREQKTVHYKKMFEGKI